MPGSIVCWLRRAPASAFCRDPAENFARFAVKLDRLNDVALPLLVEAADLCKTHVHATYGFELHDKTQYQKLLPQQYLDAAVQYYGLQNGIAVRYVHPKLPAGAGGLQPQESVVSMDGESMADRTTEDASEILRRLHRRKEGPLHLVIRGTEGMRELDMYAVSACNYPVVLIESPLMNAFADGKKIIVTTGMLDFIDHDAELALVIGHEIAHNALGHSDNVRLRKVLDALATAKTGQRAELAVTATQISFTKEFEAAADYVGMYIVARAGHDLAKIRAFWVRLARHLTWRNTPAFAITHPGYPERLTSFQSTLHEIEEKIRRQDPLNPTPISGSGK